MNRPDWLRPLFKYVVPKIQPLFFSVSSPRDVREVMERDDDFTVGRQYGPDMVCGNFVFGADRGPFFREETAFLWETFYGPGSYPAGALPPGGQFGITGKAEPPPAAVGLSERVAARVNEKIAAASRDSGQLDLVRDVIRPGCSQMVQEHLGAGPPDGQWIGVLWEVLITLGLPIVLTGGHDLNDKQNPEVADILWARATLRLAIEQEIDAAKAARDAGNRDQPNIIARMYAALASKNPAPPMDEIRDKIVRNISGLSIVSCLPIAKAAAQAVDELLSNREAFDGAAQAAKTGDKKLFWDFLEEALRFFPPFPIALRVCARDTAVGADSGCPRKVRAGQKVTVGLLAAMFDPAAVPFPDQFRTDRDPNDFLVFGYGKHACFGYWFAREMLIALLMPVFARGFARIPGRKGKLKFDLVVPKSLPVRLSPSAAGAAQC